MKGIEADIPVCEGASQIYFKSRPVPCTLKETVEAELNKLEENGVIVKVEQSDWASPIVVVPKSDRSVRICGDYKVTIIQVVDHEQYPLQHRRAQDQDQHRIKDVHNTRPHACLCANECL